MLVNQVINPGERVFILDGDIVQLAIVNANFLSLIFSLI